MNNEHIKARIQQFMEDHDLHGDNEHTCGYSQDSLGVDIESLYREAMAAGLERAAVQAENRQSMILSPGYHIEFESGFRCSNYALQYWCRQEAQRVKENYDTKEA